MFAEETISQQIFFGTCKSMKKQSSPIQNNVPWQLFTRIQKYLLLEESNLIA